MLRITVFFPTNLGGPSFCEVDVPGVVRSNWIGASWQNVPSAGVELGVAGYAALGTANDDSLATANSTPQL